MKTQHTHKPGYTVIDCLVVGTIAIAIAIAIALMFVQPVMESQTYNKLTGAHTTWWDAVWVELRVQDQPRK